MSILLNGLVKKEKKQNEQQFIIEKLLGIWKSSDGVLYYLVKWQGYEKELATWEPASEIIHAVDLIEECHSKLTHQTVKKLVKHYSSQKLL